MIIQPGVEWKAAICDAKGENGEKSGRDLPRARDAEFASSAKRAKRITRSRALINGGRRGSGRRLCQKLDDSPPPGGEAGALRKREKEEGGACSKAATKNTYAISGRRRKVKAC